MKWAASITAMFLVVPVFAAPNTDWYKIGEDQYNLGNFDLAADAFKKGFELERVESKKAAFLFNLAQSFRQSGNCKKSQFYYKRYLSFRDANPKRPLSPETRLEIEKYITKCGEVPANSLALKIIDGGLDSDLRKTPHCGVDTGRLLSKTVNGISYLVVDEDGITLHEGGFVKPSTRSTASGAKRWGFWDSADSTLAVSLDGSTHSTGICAIEFSLIKRTKTTCTEHWMGHASTIGDEK